MQKSFDYITKSNKERRTCGLHHVLCGIFIAQGGRQDITMAPCSSLIIYADLPNFTVVRLASLQRVCSLQALCYVVSLYFRYFLFFGWYTELKISMKSLDKSNNFVVDIFGKWHPNFCTNPVAVWLFGSKFCVSLIIHRTETVIISLFSFQGAVGTDFHWSPSTNTFLKYLYYRLIVFQNIIAHA